MKVSVRNVTQAGRQGIRHHQGSECDDRHRLSAVA